MELCGQKDCDILMQSSQAGIHRCEPTFTAARQFREPCVSDLGATLQMTMLNLEKT